MKEALDPPSKKFAACDFNFRMRKYAQCDPRLTETKIDSNFDDNELLGDTYTVYRNDRKQGAGRVLIAIHNSSPLKITRNINGSGESLMSTISPQVSPDLVTYYRPPSESHLEILSKILNDNSKCPLVLAGDFNLADIEWAGGQGRVRKSPRKPYFYREAPDLFKCSNLVQLVQGPTREKSNTLDLSLVESFFLLFWI